MMRDNLLTLECEITDGVGLMRMEGELIAESRYEPERILREWLEADVHRVIIEFERVTHIDSAGLSTLLAALHRFRRHEGDLILTQLNPSLSAIFEVTSMQRYFKIFDTLETAKKHFNPVPAAAPAPAKKTKSAVPGRKKMPPKSAPPAAVGKNAPKSKDAAPAAKEVASSKQKPRTKTLAANAPAKKPAAAKASTHAKR